MSALSVLHVVSLMFIQVGSRGLDYDIAAFSETLIGFSFAIAAYTLVRYIKWKEPSLLYLGFLQAVV
ncbi:MAG: hypothetical protein LAT57_06995, partial [Balneolales bacterium]|nr:hypothetical protein [Balneolales bacterium]